MTLEFAEVAQKSGVVEQLEFRRSRYRLKLNVHLVKWSMKTAWKSRTRPLAMMAKAAETIRPQTQDEGRAKSRRRQLFLAACRLLARKSFHESSVKELALEAGIAAGSIYL